MKKFLTSMIFLFLTVMISCTDIKSEKPKKVSEISMVKNQQSIVRFALSAAFVSQNGVDIYEKINSYISENSGLKTELVLGLGYQTINHMLVDGKIDFAFSCGLPYTILKDKFNNVTLVAAPVMAGKQYKNKPIYFSYLIVHKDSHDRSIEALAGKTWAYNEKLSNSGFNMPRHHFVKKQLLEDFWGRAIRSGSHEESIRLVAEKKADFSFVDSLVLEFDLHVNKGYANQVKIIDILGPSPAPPIVASNKVDRKLFNKIRNILIFMHEEKKGRELLRKALVRRFSKVSDDHYNDIRSWHKFAIQNTKVKATINTELSH